MNPIVKSVFAVVIGVSAGMLINGSLVMLGTNMIPAPITVDPENLAAIKENLHLFKPKHYLFPFLAHALGTLAGAFVTTLLVSNKDKRYGLGIGALFLLAGIAAAFIIPAHNWFVATDLLLAYIPMGWLGAKFAGGR